MASVLKYGCVSVFLVLLAVVSVRAQATHYSGIGSHCSNSTQCSARIPNSYCNYNTCICLPNYTSLNNSVCTILLGRHCGNFSDCQVPGSFCNPYPNRVCACEPSFVQFSDRFCGLGINSPCSGRRCDAINSYCDGSFCRCPANMQPDISYTRCTTSSGPVLNCTTLGCGSFGAGAYCDTRTGKCTCRGGYQMSGSFCFEIVSGRSAQNCTTMGCASFGRGGYCDTWTGNCACRSGYQMSGSYCNEIISGRSAQNCTTMGCASFGRGGYCDTWTGNCACRSGYQMSGSYCNEIISGRQVLNCTTMGCASFGRGGYCDTWTGNCACRSGYQMKGSFCYEIVYKLDDWCDEHFQICSLRRTNTTGVKCDNNKCKCRKGYTASKDKYACNSSGTIAAAISTTILAMIFRVMN